MEAEILSRTKKKQQVEELQRLGAALIALPAAQLDALALPAPLLAAVLEAQRITSHEARRRQVQYIGKIMRKVDPEPVRAAVAAIARQSSSTRASHKRLEQWRERLIGDDAALTEFMREFASGRDSVDLQALRALIRNARREIAEARPPRAQRELFRVLRDAFDD
ncbi:MAG TPA: ribosome biogenesis factor YjgA [Burkholderiales bacterium]|nr:ribosome biogenesis factor YjgA [Burkholderiales bacterium]